MTWRRFEALKWASALLKQHGRDQNIGEILLCHRLHLTRTELLADNRKSLAPQDEEWLREHIADHVQNGTPVQYMIGEAPFYGRNFRVSPAVLIPRPETEELVYRVGVWAKRFYPDRRRLSVCDIGTGSGAIAVTLKLEHPEWHVAATDISPRALAVAKKNAAALGAEVAFGTGDLTGPLNGNTFDILVSNPPYIPQREMEQLDDTVKNYEPHLALCGGGDGLDFYRRILAEAPALFGTERFFLLAFEIGAAQGPAVENLVRQAFPGRIAALSVERDTAGLDRDVMAALRLS